jgi:hypothetical protein
VKRAGLIAAGVLGALVITGVAGWLVLLRDTTDPVTVGDAVTSFRTDTEPAPTQPSPIPEGVYVYSTAGYETTDALTGVTHRYPRRSTITVASAECGVSLTWRVLKGRSTEWTYCVVPQGWLLARQDERHTFFGRTERTTYECETTPIRPAEPSVGMRWRVLDCGAGDTKERGGVRIVALPRVQVGGRSVDTVHVRKTTTFAGPVRGSSRHDIWFDSDSGVPVRIVMRSRTTNDSPIGNVQYDEDVVLRLVSLEPRR